MRMKLLSPITLVLLVSLYACSPVHAGDGRYQGISIDQHYLWVVDTNTGQVKGISS